jgi:ferrous iron transport protein B
LEDLLQAVSEVATGETVCKPYRIKVDSRALERAVNELSGMIQKLYPLLPNARWLALRLLDGDQRLMEAIQNGELGELNEDAVSKVGQNLELSLEVA